MSNQPIYSTDSIFHINLDLDKTNNMLLRDLLHYSVVLVTVHLLRCYMGYDYLLDYAMIENILFFLIGVMVYYLVIEPLVVIKGVNSGDK